MAANPQSPVEPGITLQKENYHVYHAEAHILSGHLEHPIKQPLQDFGRVVLENTRRESLITQSVGETNIEGLISFKSGHTRVVGTEVKQKVDIFGNNHAGWVTLSTAVLEGYNVVDIVTVDRVVAQVSTEHPMAHGHVPKVTFLGTRFENLRIGGFPVQVELDLGICGNKPEGDRPYVEDDDFLDRVERQLEGIASTKGLPESLEKQYDARIVYIDELRKCSNGRGNGQRNGPTKLKCTLVKSIGPIPIPGVRTFGNVIFIPNFGTVALAEVEVGVGPSHSEFRHRQGEVHAPQPSDSNYFNLNMLSMELGCPVGGTVNGGGASSNGRTHP
jgi:hypothetical protein